jgi:hypothetical protein
MNGLNCQASTFVGGPDVGVAYKGAHPIITEGLTSLHLQNNSQADFGVLNTRATIDGAWVTNFVPVENLFPEDMLAGKSQEEIEQMTYDFVDRNGGAVYSDEAN